ncbi:uncharacterized protein CBL_20225 [Carabus blaptoides fortunei]
MDNNSSIWCKRRCTKGRKDKFFENLQKEIDEGKETVIIMGDLNGRVGNNNEGKEERMEKEGEEKMNNNGDRIMDLYIQKYTREEPSKTHTDTEETESTEDKQDTERTIIFKEKEIVEAIRKIKVGKAPELANQRLSVGKTLRLRDSSSERQRYIYYLVIKPRSYQKPSYCSLWNSLCDLRDHLLENATLKLAVPKLGCGLDGLEDSLTLTNREKNPNGPSTVTSLKHRNVPADFLNPNCFGTKQS